ncbi:MAG: hypothetical protein ACLQBX_05050 [Candidatus Limnocylindrales bacterium]
MSTAPMDDYLAPGESVLATIEGIGAALFVTTTTRVVVTLATWGGHDPIVRRYAHADLRDVAVTRPRYGIGWLSLWAGDPGAQAITRVRYPACRLGRVEAAAGLIRERMGPAPTKARPPVVPGVSGRSEMSRRQRQDRPSETSVLRADLRGHVGEELG